MWGSILCLESDGSCRQLRRAPRKGLVQLSEITSAPRACPSSLLSCPAGLGGLGKHSAQA